ncbi:hypothetical protein MHB44_13395 [Lysinibacillus sp. FSL H8-0500]|uniref:hypothetical protein n=1 Tax=Lysinibacillus TaxID=400634 RepID=UPI0013793AD9|nr:hypothetical protein [Lysinibacillus macroides]QPR69120.1 hypothetical protein I6G82_05770 [Lysinibacillus macroides]
MRKTPLIEGSLYTDHPLYAGNDAQQKPLLHPLNAPPIEFIIRGSLSVVYNVVAFYNV